MTAASLLPFADVLGKSFVLLLLAFSVAGLLQISAARRHYVWLVAFVALLLLPATRLAAPLWVLSFEKPEPPAAAVSLHVPVVPVAIIAGPRPAEPIVAEWHYAYWPETAVLTWGLGAVVLLGYRLLGGFELRRLMRRSKPARERIAAIAARVAADFSVRADAYVSGECHVPMTWGTLRPVVMLPTVAEGWSDARLEAALRHECAHIARGDFLSRGVAQVVCAIYWPNPLAWLAARRWRVVQEMACDDVVLRNGAPAVDYAGQLVEVARHFIRPAIVQRHTLAMAQRSTLEARVKAVLDLRSDRSAAGWRTWAASLALLPVALAASALAQAGAEKRAAAPSPKVVMAKSRALAQEKAERIIIPSLDLENIPFAKAVDFLRRQSVKFDGEPDPAKKGVSIYIKLPADAKPPNITLKEENLTLYMALFKIARAAGVGLASTDEALEFVPPADRSGMYATATLIPASKRAFFADNTEAGMKQIMEQLGIIFPDGSRITFDEREDILNVYNTPEAQARIQTFIKDLGTKGTWDDGSMAPDFVEKKAQEIRLPKVNLRGATLAEAVDALRKSAAAVARGKSVGILLGPAAVKQAGARRITLELVDISLLEAVRYVATSAGVAVAVNQTSIEILSTEEERMRLHSGIPDQTQAVAEPESVEAQATAIRIPEVQLRDATLREALDYLHAKAIEADPRKQGVSLVLKLDAEGQSPNGKVTLQLADISLLEAVKYVAAASGMSVSVEKYAIAVISMGEQVAPLVTREYVVNPVALKDYKTNADLRKFFQDSGVQFVPGASIARNSAGRIVMRNTEVQQAVMAGLFEGNEPPPSEASASQLARVKTDRQAIFVQLETFRKITSTFPTNEQGLQALVSRPKDLGPPVKWVQLFAGMPRDPWDRPYQYRLSEDGKSFSVFSLGPEGLNTSGVTSD
ncbi:MAG: M56 family metallopeptidase [Chthoniobacterales bacterium]